MAKSKKNKKKDKKKKSLYSSFNFRSGKGGKKGGKKVKGTLTKKDLKARDKEIRKTAVMPVLEENAAKCNHANVKKYMTVSDFQDYLSAKYGSGQAAFLMSRIERATTVFGASNVRICPDCYEPVVDVAAIVDGTDPVAIMASIEAMKNAIVFRAKSKKVELINESYVKIVKNLDEVIRQYNKLIAKLEDEADEKPAKASSRSDDSDARFQSNQ